MDDASKILSNFLSNGSEIDLQRPYRVMDVANYIVQRFAEEGHPITNLLLLKMLYYLQAYFLVNNKERLFSENVQKWGYGPVEPIVYSYFKVNGASPIERTSEYVVIENNILRMITPQGRNLQHDDVLLINNIVDKLYDQFHEDPFRLVDITHEEPMWQEDKERIQSGVHNIEYNDQEIVRYFSSGDNWPWK